MIPVLRDYQTNANDQVQAAARAGKRVIVVQSPTGSGKTTIMCDLVRRAMAKDADVLLLVHRRKLVDQISDRLNQFEVPNHGIIMRGERFDRSCKVKVASRDTVLSRCLQNEWIGLPPAQLVIIDEMRHAAEGEYRRIIDHYRQQGAFVVGFDATPILSDGRGLGPWADEIVVAAKVTELISQGHLLPVRCYAPDRQRGRAGKYRRGIAGDLVESWKQYAEGLPTVLFTSRVQHGLDAVEAFKANGITAAHVDADTDEAEREDVFERVAKGDIKVLSNVGILGEGVDIPELGCCQLYFDCAGRVRFLQAAGRIMRPHGDQKYGVLIDHSGAVFRFGFPDEDTEWTLTGNVDADFARKHKDGETEQAQYCKACELVYHGQLECPQCGRRPVKPPRSIFAAPPQETSDELLTEAERGQGSDVWKREEKVKHWLRCLGVAAGRDGTFAMAAAIFNRKYAQWPGNDFPCIPPYHWRAKVRDVYPQFWRRKQSG